MAGPTLYFSESDLSLIRQRAQMRTAGFCSAAVPASLPGQGLLTVMLFPLALIIGQQLRIVHRAGQNMPGGRNAA
jgi:hypothetical protein